jgi:hypothetical protein
LKKDVFYALFPKFTYLAAKLLEKRPKTHQNIKTSPNININNEPSKERTHPTNPKRNDRQHTRNGVVVFLLLVAA